MPFPLPRRFGFTRAGLAILLSGVLVLPFGLGVTHPEVALADTTFLINGRGYGHGIGMSQWGAQGYALDHGWNCQQIVTHYFQGTTVAPSPSSFGVKVHLDKDANARSSWKIRSGTSGRSLTVADSTSSVTLSASSSYWITVSSGKVRVQTDAVNSSGTSVPGTVVKTFSNVAWATTGYSYAVQMLSASGPFSSTGLRWRGYIYFTASGTSASTAINHVGMEYYLYGVVPRESPASWPAEALKAQAVVARSYAYTSATAGQVLRCTTMSQVYNGLNGEDSRTSAAVDATKRLVVMYGSDVVKTFFSSASGGHTANIEDVWVTSTPEPYYTGVEDADVHGPYADSWGADLKLSGSALAAKIRAYDDNNGKLDYSVAAPAAVTSVSVERADSGFVTYLTVRWSNGSSYRIRGTTFQSALGLRSSKFFITIPAPTRFQETDARVAFDGYWNVGSSSVLSWGKQAWTATAGASCTVMFKGSRLAWIGNRSRTYGKAGVYVDGRYKTTVDLYSAATQYRRSLWSVDGLSEATTHTVTIRALGTKNTYSRGTNIAIDAFDVYGGSLVEAPQPLSRMEETDARIAWAGDWRRSTSSYFSGGSKKVTYMAGARAVVSFVGRGIRWLGTLASSQGVARISVDGGAFEAVDLSRPTTSNQQVAWSKSGLPFASHTAVIEAGSGSATDTPSPISIDAIETVGGGLHKADMTTLRIEDDSSAIGWAGTWTKGVSSILTGGSDRYALAAGASASLPFWGTGVSWTGNRAPSYGVAAVLIDGVGVATIDLYATRPAYQQMLFSTAGLRNGRHTLSVQVLRPTRAGSSGTVAIDAFDVTGVLALP